MGVREVMMKDDNRKAKLMTMGIAVVLILIICGISMIIHAIRRRDSAETESRLQSDIMDYANSGQEQSVTAKDVVNGSDIEGSGEGSGGTESKKEEGGKESQEAQPGNADTDNREGSSEGQDSGQENADGTNGRQDDAAGSGSQAGNAAGKPGAQEDSGEKATIVEPVKNQSSESIMDEEARKAENTPENQKTTAKWQKDVNENLASEPVDLPRQMSEMKGYWEAGNMAAVEDLAYLPRYRAASGKLSGTTKYYYYGDTDSNNRPNGKGLAMYTDNQYYYGEWKNGVRSGNGMWIKFYVYDKNAKAKDSLYLQHSYSGTWDNDLPNGDGAEHYDFIDENLDEDISYNRNFIGNFKNGLYDGEIYITNYHKDGNVKEWSGTAVNGVWQPMGEKDNQGKYPIIVELTNPDNYQWMKATENKNNGVDGIISAAK